MKFEFVRSDQFRVILTSVLLIMTFTVCAQNELDKKQVFTQHHSYSLGVSLFAGSGLDEIELFKTSDDDIATISGGGGYGVGIDLGFLVTSRFEITANLEYEGSSLSKNLNNADASFTRYYINGGFKFIIPTNSENICWKIGGGAGYYIPNTLNIWWESIPNTPDDDVDIEYNPSIGYHGIGEFEMMFPPNSWSMVINITYYYVTYDYSSVSSQNVAILDISEYEVLDGSTVNFGVAVKRYF